MFGMQCNLQWLLFYNFFAEFAYERIPNKYKKSVFSKNMDMRMMIICRDVYADLV